MFRSSTLSMLSPSFLALLLFLTLFFKTSVAPLRDPAQRGVCRKTQQQPVQVI